MVRRGQRNGGGIRDSRRRVISAQGARCDGHAREYQNRLRRRHERQQEYVQEVADTVEKMDEARERDV